MLPSTKYQLSLSYPSFTSYPVTDLFSCLGPESVFCARQLLGRPRTVEMTRKKGARYGVRVQGDCPVVVVGVEDGSYAMVGLVIVSSAYSLNCYRLQESWRGIFW